jgi:dTDP-glucose pyrophosphorylase
MPKETLPVVDKPLIHYAMEEAREAGIEQFIFVTGGVNPRSRIISTTATNSRKRLLHAARPRCESASEWDPG